MLFFFLQFHGPTMGQVDSNLRFFEQVARTFSLISLVDATDPTKREELWEARYGAYWASASLRPGMNVYAHVSVCLYVLRLRVRVRVVCCVCCVCVCVISFIST